MKVAIVTLNTCTALPAPFREPLGALTVVAALQEAGIEAKLFASSLYASADYLAVSIANWEPDVIGFSTMTANIDQSVELADILQETLNVPVIFGGWHVSGAIWHHLQGHRYDDLWQFLAQPNRYGVYGEGLVSVELIRALAADSDPAGIPGIAFVRKGRLTVPPPSQLLPLCSWPPIKRPGFESLEKKSVMTGIGCRFNCRYCQTPKMYRHLRRLSPSEASDKIIKVFNDYPATCKV